MKLRTCTTLLMQLNNYLPYFPPDHVGQMVTALPDDEVMPNWWRTKYSDKDTTTLTGLFKKCQDSLEQG